MQFAFFANSFSLVFGAYNPNGVKHQSPGLRVFALPWGNVKKETQPQRGCTLFFRIISLTLQPTTAMPQTLSCVYTHIVFSTKNRVGFLQDIDLRKKMHAYLAGIAAQQDCHALRVGGIADHVHLLVRLGREITQSDLLRELKRSSSVWVKKQSDHLGDFSWQNGSGLFSVSPNHVGKVCGYISNQEKHHRAMSFQDELRDFYRKCGMEWDENHVWD